MRFARFVLLTLISIGLLGGQFSAVAGMRGDGRRDQREQAEQAAGQRAVLTAADLLAPDNEQSQDSSPMQQAPAEPAPAHGEELESKDFATDFVLACADAAHVCAALPEMHSHSELVPTSELTLYGQHRLQI